jgi:citrate synthase
MSILKEKFASMVPDIRQRYRRLVQEHGSVKVGEVDVGAILGGLRGVKGLVCDTSSVPPDRGLLVRGIPIGELIDRLPEEMGWLLLTGQLPSAHELADMRADLAARSKVPEYVFEVIRSMPRQSHPMTMFSTAILVMENESRFRDRYDRGMKKEDYWDAAFEDAMNIIAKLPEIAAFVYRWRFNKGQPIGSDPQLDMGDNFAKMSGLGDWGGEFSKLVRLFLTLHCDHEGGNVSAFCAHTIGSALSDLYYSLAGGLNGLAGPLHGLASQNCLEWLLETNKKFGGAPTEEQLQKLTQETLDGGRLIPGYGHAVLRITDPRYLAFYDFGAKYCSEDPVYKTMARAFKVVPEVLRRRRKIKDPWPNVDAGSGALLYHYGLVEFQFYTVLFAVSRSMGICVQHILARAMGSPIVRPKSMTGDEIEKAVAAK